jgi:hypothetical protein
MSSRTPRGTRTAGWIPLLYSTLRHIIRMVQDALEFFGNKHIMKPAFELGVGGKITLRETLGSRDRWGELDSAGSG